MQILVSLVCFSLLFCACGDDGNPSADSGATDASAFDASLTADGGGVGAVCRTLLVGICSGDNFCNFSNDQCGAADSGGACEIRPMDCLGDPTDPVCGCNGQIYPGVCAATQAGQDISVLAACAPPENTFRCGYTFCEAASQYCLHDVSDVAMVADGYTCVPLPIDCQAGASCPCLTGEVCGDICASDGTGLVLTCPGG